MGMSIYVSLMNIKLCFPIQTFRTFTINLVRKQRQVTRESCSLWQLRCVYRNWETELNIMTWLKAGKNSAVSTARPAECRFTWTRVRAHCFAMCAACRRSTRWAVIHAAAPICGMCTTLLDLRVCVANGRSAGTGPAPQAAQSRLAPPRRPPDPCLNPALPACPGILAVAALMPAATSCAEPLTAPGGSIMACCSARSDSGAKGRTVTAKRS